MYRGNLNQQSDNYRKAMEDYKKVTELSPTEKNVGPVTHSVTLLAASN